MLTPADARAMGQCIARGGVAVFPADTVYAIGCDPDQPQAVDRLYELKRRPPERSAAVMLFSLAAAHATLPELLEPEREAMAALMPGPVTLLLPNRERRFLASCRGDPATLGLRVPFMEGALGALLDVGRVVMQSSANISGLPDARRIADVDGELRAGADVVLDGGELPGVASTVIDLREWASGGRWRTVREGALASDAVARALGSGAC